ncbi:MAG: glycosyltransferase family 4 protein [Bacteroidales bacterium]|nr:glycosyltransferase family 4 protein [Bacteroidales bacterium]
MNILQLCNKMPYPPKDGGSIATLNLSKGFAKLGHKVTVLAMNTSKHYFNVDNIPNDLKSKINFFDVFVNTKINPFLAFFNLLFSKTPYNAQRFISVDFKNKLVSLLLKNNYDIIQLEGLYVFAYIEVIRKYSNAKIAYRSHNIEHEIWERTTEQQNGILKKFYLKILYKRIKKFEINIINKYDALVPITERDASFFNKFGNNKSCHVSVAGFNTAELKPNFLNTEFPSLFYIGALDWVPNQEGLFWFIENVWKIITKNYKNLKFYVAGRNAPKWVVNNLKEENIYYLGEIDDAYEYMNSKAIMIVPLLSGSGMRIKIIEGMALGKTIISTSIGAEGINITNKKNIIIADKPDDFIKGIESVINNKVFSDEIGENAVAFVNKNYDNLTISSSLINFYKGLF